MTDDVTQVDVPEAFGKGAKPVNEEARTSMLLAMYSEMWANINRHITLVWQSVGIVVGTLAVVAFVGQKVLSIDVAVSVIVALAAWELAHVIDASGWYNRNLYIIRNIERSFLTSADSSLVHPLFMGPPRRGAMVEHLRIQFALGVIFELAALAYHFTVRLWPDFPQGKATLKLVTLVPYAFAVSYGCCLIVFSRHIRRQYDRLTTQAPGSNLNES